MTARPGRGRITSPGNGFVPDGLDFAGRPQLAARLRGAGGGRSLLLNGHIDAVSAEPVDRWTSPPLAAGVDLSSHAALTEAPEELGDDELRGRLLGMDDSA